MEYLRKTIAEIRVQNVSSQLFAWFMRLNTEKVAKGGLGTMIAYAGIRSLFSAASKPFWSDELITLCLARQPNLSSIWHALQSAVDVNPPPYYLLERFSGALALDEHLAYRLSSILAFCCVVLCIFLFVKKRSGSGCALLCAAIPLVSVLFDVYAVEARGYTLITAFVAIAVVSYQRIESTQWWALLMGFSLSAAETIHYYAIFALAPFALAETARIVDKRELRPSVWLAILSGLIPLGIFWSLLWNVKRYYGAHYWSHFGLLDLTNVYGWFFNLSTPWGIGIAAFTLVGLLSAMFLWSSRDSFNDREGQAPLHEFVLVLGFLILPLVIFATIKITHGGLVNRYMLLSLLGFPLAAGLIMCRLDRKVLILFAVFLSSALATQEVRFWFHQRGHLGKSPSPANAAQQMIRTIGYGDLPVVVSDGLIYMQLVHYASADWAKRLVVVVDLPEAVIYAGSDNVDKNLLVLRSYLPLQIYEFHDFTAKHATFLLYSTQGTEWNWWPERLLRDGYSLRLVALRDNLKIYLVSSKQ